ncbi:MAG: hypothetical protein BalsKO_10130 [Balneolaceae bacterium]
MKKLKKDREFILPIFRIKTSRLLLVLIFISTVIGQQSLAQNAELKRLIEKAESFYPSNLDSVLLLSNMVLDELRDASLDKLTRRESTDLKGWASRRKGDIRTLRGYSSKE